MKIYIFGDSITEGMNDTEKGGWVNRLKETLSNDEIYNLGVSGDTTADLLKRFEEDIEGKKPDMLVFAIGINDSIYLPNEKRNYVDLDKFKNNLKIIIEKAKKLTNNIIFVGLTPVDEKLTMPISWELEMHYTNEEVKKYNNAIRQICESEKLKFVDIFTEMVKINYTELLFEGLHPNAEGHEWLAKKINRELNH